MPFFSGFILRFEKKACQKPREHRSRDAAGGGGQAARENAEKAFFVHGLFNALGDEISESRQRDGSARARKFDERLIDAHGTQRDAYDHIADEDTRGGELRFVDEDLADEAQRPADEKCL